MDSPPIIWAEPQYFAAGDSLIFQRYLPGFLPSDGWSITGTVTLPTPTGGKLITQYNSTADSTGQFHLINVASFMANAADGDYVLSEVVICSPTGVSPNQRSTIYHGELKIDADFTDGLANALITTHEQRMIPLLQAQLERLAAFDLTKTNVQRSEFFVVERDKVLEEYKWYMEKRNNQLAISRQRDTGRNQISIQPVNAGGW